MPQTDKLKFMQKKSMPVAEWEELMEITIRSACSERPGAGAENDGNDVNS